MEERTQVLFLKRSNFIKFILLLSFFSLSFLGIVYSIARESINYEKDTFIVDQGSSLNSILNKLKGVIEDVIKISEFNSEAKSLIEILKESEINLEELIK